MDLYGFKFTLIRYSLLLLALTPITALASNNPYSVGIDLGITKPTNIAQSTTFPLGYSTFIYSSNNHDTHALITGISLDKTLTINSLYSLQAGISYHYIGNMNAKGNLAQGISLPYYQSIYTYSVSSSQYLVDAKFRCEFNRFFPYFYFGAGIASNSAYDYSTTVPAYLTVTPNYGNRTKNSFTYSLGIGVDFFVKPKFTIGVGYRFINLGKVGLGTDRIRNTRIAAELTQSNLYLNTLLIQFNYYI